MHPSFPIEIERFLKTLGLMPHPNKLAQYFESQFLKSSLAQDPGVQAQTFSLVEGERLNESLLDLFRVNEVQNLLNHACQGELDVLVIRQNLPPHDQHWRVGFTSNFNLIQSSPQVLGWTLHCQYDAQQQTLLNFQIQFDETAFKSLAPTLKAYLQFHGCLWTPPVH
jgi:hypothetical protein